jgi:hypothetical protein
MKLVSVAELDAHDEALARYNKRLLENGHTDPGADCDENRADYLLFAAMCGPRKDATIRAMAELLGECREACMCSDTDGAKMVKRIDAVLAGGGE